MSCRRKARKVSPPSAISHAVIATSLLLAACSGGSGSGNNQSDEVPVAQVQEQTPENLTDDPQNSVVPLGSRGNAGMPGPAPLATIPARFQGRWGMTAADCDPSTGADLFRREA